MSTRTLLFLCLGAIVATDISVSRQEGAYDLLAGLLRVTFGGP